jgi:DNA polymerase III subunit beta
MKISANAGELSSALALADSLITAPVIKLKMASLLAVHLKAADDALAVSANVLDHMVTLRVSADVAEPGELATNATRLAGLVAGFSAKAMVELATIDTSMLVSGGRSRFRLPAIARDELPPPLTLTGESGRVELAREEAMSLLRPAFAMSTEQTRFYLCGIFLHDTDAGLAAAATDGHRLVRVSVPGAAGLSCDRALIVPATAVGIILKLLRDRTTERLVLRRSKTLIAIESSRFAFVSKLIDGTFPDYERIIPRPSGNSVIVDCVALKPAIARLAAVADPAAQVAPLAGFEWSAGESVLRLCFAGWPELADDELAAETSGTGKVALNVRQLRQLLDAIDSERIRFASNSAREPVLVTDPDDAEWLAVQMPSVWPFQNSKAA